MSHATASAPSGPTRRPTARPAATARPCHTRRRLERLARPLSVDAVAAMSADAAAAFHFVVRPAAVHALHRLADGSYGRCEDCGERIAPARLADVPYARRCATCQRDAEARWRGLDAMIADRARTLVGEPQGPIGVAA